jgi:hypothetical protein
VGVDFFDILEVPILTGRRFTSGDLEPERSGVIVNRAFVQEFLGDADVIGRRVRYVEGGFAEPGRWYEIVGVTGDLIPNSNNPGDVYGTLYHPLKRGRVVYPVHLAVRVGSTPADFAPRLREITTALDPTLQLHNVLPLEEVRSQGRAASRLYARVLALGALSVLLLSTAGIYALMSFAVTQRRREIGIRVALGAHPRRILGSIFSRALGQLAIGVVGGVLVVPLLDGLAGGELLGGDGAVLLPAVAAVMMAVGLVGTVGPARRGLRIQPTEALREGG